MKALSLWQPYASLIAVGAKQYETRSWSTSYRGPLVIHAAKRWTIDEQAICAYPPFCTVLAQNGISARQMPLGAALCVANLTDIVPVEAVRHKIGVLEHAFGDYEDGRFAWKLVNVRRFFKPVPMRGAQGLFDAPISAPLTDLVYP